VEVTASDERTYGMDYGRKRFYGYRPHGSAL